MLIPLLVLLMPTSWIPIAGITVIEHRMLAIFFAALFFWILEPIPIFATSVVVVILELLMISDKGLIWLRGSGEMFGTPLKYAALLQTFAAPVIMLFLGGLFLAAAATKYKLDVNLARVMLKPFGKNPSMVLLGFMLITAVFSMFMSNTATTALMLAIVAPVLQLFKADDPGKIAFVLSVPFAANVGGMGTPIGTPPNAIGIKYLTGNMAVTFGEWTTFGVPFAIIMLLAVWGLLITFSKPREKSMELAVKGKFRTDWKAIVVYVTFALSIILWLTGSVHGLNSYTVAMLPIGVFITTGILTVEDMKKLSWDVLWLIAGGIALGDGLENTGLSKHIVESIPFASLSPWMIMISATMLALVMSTFISNTATANLLLPIMAALAATIPSLADVGGAKMLIIAIAFSCSFAMALPISTPPNALAYATGMVDNKQMVKTGSIVGILGLLLLYVMVIILKQIGFV
ncbi:MAG: SLC13/DASS family transporter [SAR324 cluster bacterium]|nr:SLC13/DASS family transporter [SAR324 cluster bacterium]